MTQAIILIAALLAGSGQQHSAVTLWSEHPIAVEIEFLTIAPDGRHSVTDRRSLMVQAGTSLPLSDGPSRFVRFSYSGVSPRTYSSSELIAAEKLRLDTLPGGELLVIVPPAIVRPVELRVAGARSLLVPVKASHHVSASGLPPGRYQVEPVYLGGRRGKAQTFDVAGSKSTIAPMPVESVGGVIVQGSPETCRTATIFSVAEHRRPGAKLTRRPWSFGDNSPRCHYRIEGLEPGKYDASYAGWSGGLGEAAFDAAAQQITHVTIADATVSVSGRITLNGTPLANVSVAFSRLGSGARSATPLKVFTDGGGYYHGATVGVPGTYTLTLARPPKTLARHVTTFQAGAQTFDWAITAGVIDAQVVGWDGKEVLRLNVDSPQHFATSALPQGRSSHRFEALPFGTYYVDVSIGGRPYPALRQSVTVSPDSPRASVRLELPKR